MKTFNQLKKNLKKDFTGFKQIKVAIICDTASQLLNQIIKSVGYEYNFDLSIWESDFNQVERQVLDFSSELYEYNPEIVIVFQSSHKLLAKYNKSDLVDSINLASNRLDFVATLANNIQNP